VNFKYKLLRAFRLIKPYSSRVVVSTGNKCKRNKVVLFAIHLRKLKLAQYLILSCEELSANGYDIALIVTYDKSLDLKNVQKLLEKEFEKYFILIRANYGKDFGSFKDGLKYINKQKCTDIILLNDSIIGPLFSSTFITDIDKLESDVIGITDSYDIFYHLQSSLLKFSGSDNIRLLCDFFDMYEPSNDREIIVRFGEVGLSKYFIECDKNLLPFAPSIHLWSHSGYTHKLEDNPQHAYWSQLIFEYNVPYIKRELIVSDPSKFLKYTDKRFSKESLDLIDDALKYRIK
tara:strand:+ start:371 stop:1237 length:867 start_codon:yes stop_codon:yes gene_type:complete